MNSNAGQFPLPPDLPVPVDDGAAAHLAGARLPAIVLPSTSGPGVDLAALRGWTVIYVYPMTGRPGIPLPDGWDAIPGARGCSPQSCGFRDHHAELASLGARVFGLSTQSTEYQAEARKRLELPFDLLSDTGHALRERLALPTFTVDGKELYKRLTMIVRDDMIRGVLYPVFPPDRNAADVVEWLRKNSG